MEETTAIKFLKSYGKLLEDIKKAKLKKDAAWDRATACGGTGGTGAGGSSSDRVGINIAEYEYWGNTVRELNAKAEEVMKKISRITDKMAEPFGSIILMRYINCWGIKTIAEEINFSTEHTRRLLRRAEEIFEFYYEFLKDVG